MSLILKPFRRFTVKIVPAAIVLMIAALTLPTRPNHGDIGDQAAAQSNVGPVEVTPGTAGKPISFRDRLIVGLRAVSTSDVAFVDSVVAKVYAGKLPERLVDQTFFGPASGPAAPQAVAPIAPSSTSGPR